MTFNHATIHWWNINFVKTHRLNITTTLCCYRKNIIVVWNVRNQQKLNGWWKFECENKPWIFSKWSITFHFSVSLVSYVELNSLGPFQSWRKNQRARIISRSAKLLSKQVWHNVNSINFWKTLPKFHFFFNWHSIFCDSSFKYSTKWMFPRI